MTSVAVPPVATPNRGDNEDEREAVHVVTWRLLDYDGGELTYGGLQRWLLALIDLLRDNGHPVWIHQRSHAPFTRELAAGVTVRGHQSTPRSRGTPSFNLRAHREIPDDAPVIYMADDVSFPVCRRRSVLIQHGVWWDGECGRVKLRLIEYIVRRSLRRSAGFICVDTNFINWLRARWPMLGVDDKLHYIPNFIDPELWGPQPARPAAYASAPTSDPAGERLTICFPRRSEPRRGVLLMSEVAPDLMRRYPQIRFRFVVGSGYYTEALRKRLMAASIDAERWTIEVLPFDQMRDAYESSAIVVIPTLCGEGTSLSAIEAMYFGCAVVSTWVGGLPNLIQDEHNGLLIAPRSADLTEALARVIEDAELRTNLGRQAMRTVLPQFGIQRWRRKTSRVLSAALRLGQEVRL